MSTAIEDAQQGKHAYYAPHLGTVIDNADPEGLHRVRVEIPNLIEKSHWAWPFGTNGGGSKQRGAWRVPEKGASVIVQFLGGDVERPIYTAAWWGVQEDGTDERPSEVKEVTPVADAHQVAGIYEGRRLKVWVDERDGKQQLGIQDKGSEGMSPEAIAMLPYVQIDLENGSITLSSVAGTTIKSLGRIDLVGTEVYIMGRQVLPGSKPL